MSDALIQLQSLGTYRVPAWFTEQNSLFDDAREDFSNALLNWTQATGFVLRLFNDLWNPVFATPTVVGDVPGAAWVAPAVTLANVARLDGYCKADGVRFPAVAAGANPLMGAAIYISSSGKLVWAATGFFGNLPVLSQDVYVVWDSAFGAVFRI